MINKKYIIKFWRLNMKVIDMHCDTMKAILDNRDENRYVNLKKNGFSVDIEKM